MEIVAAAHVDSPFHFSFREPTALPDPLLSIENAAAGYADRKIIDRVSITLRPAAASACSAATAPANRR
jgi:ATP-binding cassette subfamily F protein 3